MKFTAGCRLFAFLGAWFQLMAKNQGLAAAAALRSALPRTRSTEVSSMFVPDPRTPLKIVLLGDSYSAGNGARDANGNYNYYGPPMCHRSPTNWAQPFAEALNETLAVTFVNRACAFAVAPNFFEPQPLATVRGKCPQPQYPDEMYTQVSPTQCDYAMRPQIEAVDNQTDLIVLTMGGNDLGFAPTIGYCLLLLNARLCQRTLVKDRSLIPILAQRMEAALVAFYHRMKPGGKVILCSYPLPVLSNVSFVLRGPGVKVDLTKEFRAMLSDAMSALSQAVQRANANVSQPFALFWNDTQTIFAGHEVDPRPVLRNPARWIHEVEGRPQDYIQYFHPTPTGWHQWSLALTASQGSTLAAWARTRSFDSTGMMMTEPYAWAGEAYAGRTGQPVTLDASGSYDPQGFQLVSYAWDWNGDGQFDEVVTGQTRIPHSWEQPYQGRVSLQVTSVNGATAVATAYVHIMDDESQAGSSSCPADSQGQPIFWQDGNWTACLPFYGFSSDYR